MAFLYFLLSIISWIETLICFIIFIPVQTLLFLVTSPFDKNKKIMHYNTSILCKVVLALCPLISIDYEGLKNIDRSKPSVIIMNHQSILDILLIFTIFYPAKMIAKKSLARVPVITSYSIHYTKLYDILKYWRYHENCCLLFGIARIIWPLRFAFRSI